MGGQLRAANSEVHDKVPESVSKRRCLHTEFQKDEPVYTCWRSKWGKKDRCIWHYPTTEEKTVEELREFRSNGPERLDGAVLSEMELGDKLSFEGCTLRKANFEDCRLEGVNFSGANLQETNFVNAKLMESNLIGVSLIRANLSRVNFREALLKSSDLSEAEVTETYFRNTELNECNFDSVELREANLIGANFVQIDLTAFDFSDTTLRGANFTNSSLSKASFAGANLTKCVFTGSDLENTDLRSSTLNFTTFNQSSLKNADFHGSDGEKVTFRGCDLKGTDIRIEGAIEITDCNVADSRYSFDENVSVSTSTVIKTLQSQPETSQTEEEGKVQIEFQCATGSYVEMGVLSQFLANMEAVFRLLPKEHRVPEVKDFRNSREITNRLLTNLPAQYGPDELQADEERTLHISKLSKESPLSMTLVVLTGMVTPLIWTLVLTGGRVEFKTMPPSVTIELSSGIGEGLRELNDAMTTIVSKRKRSAIRNQQLKETDRENEQSDEQSDNNQ